MSPAPSLSRQSASRPTRCNHLQPYHFGYRTFGSFLPNLAQTSCLIATFHNAICFVLSARLTLAL